MASWGGRPATAEHGASSRAKPGRAGRQLVPLAPGPWASAGASPGHLGDDRVHAHGALGTLESDAAVGVLPCRAGAALASGGVAGGKPSRSCQLVPAAGRPRACRLTVGAVAGIDLGADPCRLMKGREGTAAREEPPPGRCTRADTRTATPPSPGQVHLGLHMEGTWRTAGTPAAYSAAAGWQAAEAGRAAVDPSTCPADAAAPRAWARRRGERPVVPVQLGALLPHPSRPQGPCAGGGCGPTRRRRRRRSRRPAAAGGRRRQGPGAWWWPLDSFEGGGGRGHTAERRMAT